MSPGCFTNFTTNSGPTTLDPDYALAMFNLGGVYWNDGDLIAAARVWRLAIQKFPDHALAAEVREMLPLLTP